MSKLFSQRKRKGLVGFILLILLILTGFIFLFISHVSIMNSELLIERTIMINMKVDDRGTEFLSLTNMVMDDENYMKILGEMLASNAPSGLGDEIKTTLDGIHDYYVFNLQYSGMADKTFSKGQSSEGEEYQMEIPAPGAQAGKTKAYVNLKR